MSQDHFVITIDIKKVTFSSPAASNRSNYNSAFNKDSSITTREVEDVTHVVVKAKTLPEAIVKVNGILEVSHVGGE